MRIDITCSRFKKEVLKGLNCKEIYESCDSLDANGLRWWEKA